MRPLTKYLLTALFSVILASLLEGDPGTPCQPKPGYEWSGADVEIVYLNPREYPGLPKNIAAWLGSRSFTIPQSYCDSTAHNAFVGDLGGPGSADWAVLASRADSSRVIVFWNGSTDSVSEVNQYPDVYFVCEGRRFGFPRLIVPTKPADELSRYSYYEDTPPIAMDHSCLEDIYCEKASQVFYWHRGQRYDLIGAD